MRFSNLTGDYVTGGMITDRQQITTVGGEVTLPLTYKPGTEEVYLGGVRQLVGASEYYTTVPGAIQLNAPATPGQSILLIGKGEVLDLPFGRATSELISLYNGQVDVSFTTVSTKDLDIHVSGINMIGSKLLPTRDYEVTGLSTIRLAQSYPVGTVLEAISGGRVAADNLGEVPIDDGTTIKSISRRFAATQESDDYFREKEGSQILNAVVGTTLIRLRKDDAGEFLADNTGTYPVLRYRNSVWDPAISGTSRLQVQSISTTSDTMTLQVIDLDTTTASDVQYARRSGYTAGGTYTALTTADVASSSATQKTISGGVLKSLLDALSTFSELTVDTLGADTAIDTLGISIVNGGIFVGSDADNGVTLTGANGAILVTSKKAGVDTEILSSEGDNLILPAGSKIGADEILTAGSNVVTSNSKDVSVESIGGVSHVIAQDGLNRVRLSMSTTGVSFSKSSDEGATYSNILSTDGTAMTVGAHNVYHAGNKPQWTDIGNRPAIFSGSYSDLTDVPPAAVGFSGDYMDLTNVPPLAAQSHSHAGVYSPSDHNHSGVYAPNNHAHSEYASAGHTHSNYRDNSVPLVTADVDGLQEQLDSKPNAVELSLADGNMGVEFTEGATIQVVTGVSSSTTPMLATLSPGVVAHAVPYNNGTYLSRVDLFSGAVVTTDTPVRLPSGAYSEGMLALDSDTIVLISSQEVYVYRFGTAWTLVTSNRPGPNINGSMRTGLNKFSIRGNTTIEYTLDGNTLTAVDAGNSNSVRTAKDLRIGGNRFVSSGAIYSSDTGAVVSSANDISTNNWLCDNYGDRMFLNFIPNSYPELCVYNSVSLNKVHTIPMPRDIGKDAKSVVHIGDWNVATAKYGDITRYDASLSRTQLELLV